MGEKQFKSSTELPLKGLLDQLLWNPEICLPKSWQKLWILNFLKKNLNRIRTFMQKSISIQYVNMRFLKHTWTNKSHCEVRLPKCYVLLRLNPKRKHTLQLNLVRNWSFLMMLLLNNWRSIAIVSHVRVACEQGQQAKNKNKTCVQIHN